VSGRDITLASFQIDKLLEVVHVWPFPAALPDRSQAPLPLEVPNRAGVTEPEKGGSLPGGEEAREWRACRFIPQACHLLPQPGHLLPERFQFGRNGLKQQFG
jgi:hypothetical protein